MLGTRLAPALGAADPMVPHEQVLLRLLAAGDVPPVVTFGFSDPDVQEA